MKSLSGLVALVTGGGRGIGRAIAEALAERGASVAILARSESELTETVGSIKAQGGVAAAYVADVTDRPAIERIAGEIESSLGSIDLLINNAGTTGPISPISETDPDEWWRCLEINLYGPHLLVRTVLPSMLRRRKGRIVNLASGSGTRAMPNLSAYGVSKTALIRYTETLQAEVGSMGLGIFAIEPGMVRTAMAERALSIEGKRMLPWFEPMMERHGVGPEHAAALVVAIAEGKADELAGRLLIATDSLDRLNREAERIKREESYLLRMNLLADS